MTLKIEIVKDDQVIAVHVIDDPRHAIIKVFNELHPDLQMRFPTESEDDCDR